MQSEKFQNTAQEYLTELKEITRSLHNMASLIFGLLIFNLGMLALSSLLYGNLLENSPIRSFSTTFLVLGLITPLVAIGILFRFGQLVSRGNIISTEIHDEAESSESLSESRRVPMGIRIRIKEYTRASKLPLVPYEFGMAVYFVIFVMILIVLTFLTS